MNFEFDLFIRNERISIISLLLINLVSWEFLILGNPDFFTN